MKHLISLKDFEGNTLIINPDHIVRISFEENIHHIHLDNGEVHSVIMDEYQLVELIENSYE